MSQVKIQGNASGTGIFTVASPNSNTDRTLTLPDNTGTVLTSASTGISASNITTGTLPKAQMPSGSVLQVVSATKTDTFSYGSSTYGDITGLSVAITPISTSSKILVIASVNALATSNNCYLRFTRNGSALAVGDASGSRVQATSGPARIADSGNVDTVPLLHLDSPSSSSEVTYKVQVAAQSAAQTYINRSNDDNNDQGRGRYVSTITVLEIAG